MKRLSARAHVANRNPLAKHPETRTKISISSPTRVDNPTPFPLMSDIDSRSQISPVPPSYKSTPFSQRIEKTELNRSDSPLNLVLPIKQAASQPKEKKNLDDAWKNIKMEQDEQYADIFRNDMLLTRCWQIWRQGFQWITVSILAMQRMC